MFPQSPTHLLRRTRGRLWPVLLQPSAKRLMADFAHQWNTANALFIVLDDVDAAVEGVTAF